MFSRRILYQSISKYFLIVTAIVLLMAGAAWADGLINLDDMKWLPGDVQPTEVTAEADWYGPYNVLYLGYQDGWPYVAFANNYGIKFNNDLVGWNMLGIAATAQSHSRKLYVQVQGNTVIGFQLQ